VQAEEDLAAALGPRRHQTLSLHDHVYIGPDARTDRARTLQVIEAIAPGVESIPFLCDTNVLTIEFGQGCKELASPLRQVGADVFAAEIRLARKLELGETLTLEYWTTYRYPGDLEDPNEREWRRAVVRQLDNYDIRVQFHPDRLPAGVWWARWDGTEGDVLERQQVSLDSQFSVHRYLRSFERAVAGFYWQWE
jgi:hypothetical protein